MAKRAQQVSPPLTQPAPDPGPGPVVETRTKPVGLVDPEVHKPAGVTAASSRADELWQQAYGQQEPSAGTDAHPDSGSNTPEPPPAEGPGDGRSDGTILDGSQVQDPNLTAREPGRNIPGERSPAHVPPEDWEHRYHSMRGRHDQLAEQNRQLMQRLGALERQVAQPLAREQTFQRQQQPPQPTRQPLVTQEEREEYGVDFLDVVARQARENISPELQQLRGEMNMIRQQLGSVGTHIAMSARERMEAELDNVLPEWRSVNMEQDFLDWLSLSDAYSGANRHALLRQAFERNETPRVLAFFQGFLAEATAARPAQRQPAPAGTRQSPQPQMDLTRLAAPGRGRAAAAQQPSADNKPFISRDDIARFYNDVRAGRYAGREAEKQQHERELMEAQREGRIL